MTEVKPEKRRRRGASPRGEFKAAKSFATASEDARVAAETQFRGIANSASSVNRNIPGRNFGRSSPIRRMSELFEHVMVIAVDCRDFSLLSLAVG